MNKHFKDYYWKGGIPQGLSPCDESGTDISYKIVMDPYRKRISIETYAFGVFKNITYDSVLLDFRHLTPANQTAWQKLILEETAEKVISIIKNQDDRVLYLETYIFENGVCRECKVHSPHGPLLAVHKMFYHSLQDPFTGVVLFDANEHPVMYKRYEMDEESKEFTELLQEEWNDAKNYLSLPQH